MLVEGGEQPLDLLARDRAPAQLGDEIAQDRLEIRLAAHGVEDPVAAAVLDRAAALLVAAAGHVGSLAGPYTGSVAGTRMRSSRGWLVVGWLAGGCATSAGLPDAGSEGEAGSVAAKPDSAPAPACADPASLTVDLDAVAAELAGLRWEHGEMGEWVADPGAPTLADAPDYAPLLRALGMTELADAVALRPDLSPGEIYDCELTIVAAPPGLTRDTLVRVDCHNFEFSDWGVDGTARTTARVLREQGEGRYCSLGEISRESLLTDTPCLFSPPERARAVELGWVELLEPGRFGLREDIYGGSCGAGTERGDDVRVRLHGEVDGRLAVLLEAPISMAMYTSPCPPEQSLVGTIELDAVGAGWPRAITVSEASVCLDDDELDESCGYVGDCVARESKTRYRYVEGRYRAEPAEAAEVAQ